MYMLSSRCGSSSSHRSSSSNHSSCSSHSGGGEDGGGCGNTVTVTVTQFAKKT